MIITAGRHEEQHCGDAPRRRPPPGSASEARPVRLRLPHQPHASTDRQKNLMPQSPQRAIVGGDRIVAPRLQSGLNISPIWPESALIWRDRLTRGQPGS
jgi:hypothetical protein